MPSLKMVVTPVGKGGVDDDGSGDEDTEGDCRIAED
jgi:hypothetical protein